MEKHNNFNTSEKAEQRFGMYFLIFRISGISFIPHTYPNIYMLYAICSCLCAHTNVLAMILDILQHTDDLQYCMDGVQAVGAMITALWIRLFISFRKNVILKLLILSDPFEWEEQPTRDTNSGRRTMASMIPQIPLFTKRMCIFISAYYGILSFVRFMNGDDYQLMFNVYYYFEVTYSPVYEIIYLSQIMAATVYILTFANSIGLYASIMAITCSQLEKLRANLLDIRQKPDISEQDSGAETDTQEEETQVHTSQEVFCRMQKQLNDCIHHHQQIIRYMRTVEEIFNPFLVGLFLLLMCGICLTAFSVAMAVAGLLMWDALSDERTGLAFARVTVGCLLSNWGNMYSLTEALLIYCFLMLMLCVYCRFGEELTNQAESVRHAAWGCDWVGTPVPFQRCLLFIIVTANKEFRLTAGKFVTVSNKTLINIFNQTISFLMFLIQVKDQTEGNQNT